MAVPREEGEDDLTFDRDGMSVVRGQIQPLEARVLQPLDGVGEEAHAAEKAVRGRALPVPGL